MLTDKDNVFLLDIKEPLLNLSCIPKKHEVQEITEPNMINIEKLDFKDANVVKIGTEYLEVLVKILKKNKLDSAGLFVKNDYPLKAVFGEDQANIMIIAPRVE